LGGTSIQLNAVSCSSSGNCAAVGGLTPPPSGTVEPGTIHPFYATELNGFWGTATVPSDPPVSSGSLTSLSCPSAVVCGAAGLVLASGNNTVFTMDEVSGKWVGEEVSHADSTISTFGAIACTGPDTCVIDGSLNFGFAGTRPFVDEQTPANFAAWGTATSAPFNLTSTQGGYAWRIACAQSGTCVAGGQLDDTSSPDLSDLVISFEQPTVSGVKPDATLPAGGKVVTVRGTGFSSSGLSVYFGTKRASNVKVVSSTELTAVAPAEKAASVNVVVSTPIGASVANTLSSFFYELKPTVTKVSSSSGSKRGGKAVTISGTNLLGATKVVFGTAADVNFVVESSTEIEVVTPPGKGTVDVRVATPLGTSPKNTKATFRYT
jgi:hypothetical protein